MFTDVITQIITCPGKTQKSIVKYAVKTTETVNLYEKKLEIRTNRKKIKIKVMPVAKQNTHPSMAEGNP